MSKTILLPDGYNGDMVKCYTRPLEVMGNTVKLGVVGSTYLFRWCYVEQLRANKK